MRRFISYLPFIGKRYQHSMASIQSNLVNSVSLIFGAILLVVFLSVDTGMDHWVEEQFDAAMINRANYLKSQVSIENGALVMSFDKQVMPQYQKEKHPQFFQLWQNDTSLVRSESLARFPHSNLIRSTLPVGKDRIFPLMMPNGEEGRALISTFIPKNAPAETEPLHLTVYESAHSLDVLWIVDILLVTSFLLAMTLVRYITNLLILKGLAPLVKLNDELKQFSDLKQRGERVSHFVKPTNPVKEIEPIRNELNAFIDANSQLVANEKRITSDIAHELKTPIAEILALSEIHLLYPDDERISKTYPDDILHIAQRMKAIVENLLLLQRASSPSLIVTQEKIALATLTNRVQSALGFKYPQLPQRVQIHYQTIEHIVADTFIMETILTNLLDNALFYSPADSVVDVLWYQENQQAFLTISNSHANKLSNEQLDNITQPLYQVDSSRTSNQRFGLGLSIVSNLCQQCHYTLSFAQSSDRCFTVTVRLGKVSV
ncbi:HAMP domain-containing histidine kinase [Vibrio tritonius]|uniref:histidine kinase n=1 Tax=Vibrio tritonius TaxID=1435069 RepID=A0ABS7YS20_9VIBR|nr:HAMP domain-containing sensor histidine kinase [Vibrio tritonius]MCA2017661.1 HAMP domain-containing histidine kinase [Vibrio tritonius]